MGMTREEAKEVFLNRGLVEVEGGTIFDGNKWRQACVVISKWLEQEPCEDAISREDAIKAVYGLCDKSTGIFEENPHIDAVWEVLENLTSVLLEPKSDWIPVSERLPEDNKTYLVTIELTFARGERYVSQERKDDWDKLKECGHEIIAWMPLPKPYRAESEDKE